MAWRNVAIVQVGCLIEVAGADCARPVQDAVAARGCIARMGQANMPGGYGYVK